MSSAQPLEDNVQPSAPSQPVRVESSDKQLGHLRSSVPVEGERLRSKPKIGWLLRLTAAANCSPRMWFQPVPKVRLILGSWSITWSIFSGPPFSVGVASCLVRDL